MKSWTDSIACFSRPTDSDVLSCQALDPNGFFEVRETQNLQDSVRTFLDFQMAAHDRDDHVDRRSDPGPVLRGVLRGAEE